MRSRLSAGQFPIHPKHVPEEEGTEFDKCWAVGKKGRNADCEAGMPQEGFLEEVDDFAHGTRGQKAGQIGNLIAIVIITISHLSKKPVVGGCPVSPVQFRLNIGSLGSLNAPL